MNPISDGDRFFHLLGITIEEQSPDHSRVCMPITEKLLNGMDMVNGGAIFTLADIAFGVAANYGQETGTVTMSMNIQYLEPGVVSPLWAEARLIRGGRHVVFYEVTVTDGNGAKVAYATAQGFRTKHRFVKRDMTAKAAE